MTQALDIVVPALTLPDSTGAIDREATRQYAKRAAASRPTSTSSRTGPRGPPN
jgi:hypothetical protein